MRRGNRLVALAAADRPGLPQLGVSGISTGQQEVVLPRCSGWTGWTAHWLMSRYSCDPLPCCAWSVCGFDSLSQLRPGLSSDGQESLLPPQGR